MHKNKLVPWLLALIYALFTPAIIASDDGYSIGWLLLPEQNYYQNSTSEDKEFTVFLPADQWLKISTTEPSSNLLISLQATISPGLLYPLLPDVISNTESLVTAGDSNRLIMIKNLASSKQPLRLQLGKKIPPSYRVVSGQMMVDEQSVADTNTLQIQPAGYKSGRVKLMPGRVTEYSIKGPVLLKINSMAVASSITTEPTGWSIEARLDDKPLQQWQHSAGISRRQFYQTGDTVFWATTNKSYSLQIPQGEHRLTLEVSRSVWASIETTAGNFAMPSNQTFLFQDSKQQQQQLLSEQQDEQQAASLFNSISWIDNPGKVLTRLQTKLNDDKLLSVISRWSNIYYRQLYPSTEQGIKAINRQSSAMQWQSNDVLPISYIEQQALRIPATEKTLFFELDKSQPLLFQLPEQRLLTDIKVKLYNPEKISGQLLIANAQQSIRLELASQRFSDWPQQRSNAVIFAQLKVQNDAQHHQLISISEPVIHSEMKLQVDDKNRQLTITSNRDQPVYLSVSYPVSALVKNDQQSWIKQFNRQSKLSWLEKDIKQLPADIQYQVWQLKKLLTARHQQFNEGTNLSAQKPIADNADLDWLSRARNLKSNNHIGELAELLFVNIDAADDQLWQWRLQLLQDNGLWSEYFSLLKGLVAQQGNQTLKNYAEQQLRQYLMDTNNQLVLEQMLADQLYQNPGQQQLYDFANVQFIKGQYEIALGSLMMMAQTDESAQLALWTAVQLKYWQLYEQLLQFLDKDSRIYFENLRQWFAGRKMTNNSSNISIPETLRSSRLTAVSAASVLRIWNPMLDKYSKQYQANARQPLKMTITGPLTLDLQVRQLITAAGQQQDDWLTINIDGQDYLFPLHKNNYISQLVINDGKEVVAAQQNIQINIGDGQHQLTIAPRLNAVALNPRLMASAIPDLYLSPVANCTEIDNWKLVSSDAEPLTSCLMQPQVQSQVQPPIKPSVTRSEPTPGSYFSAQGDNRGLQGLTEKIWLWEQQGKQDDELLQEIIHDLSQQLDNWNYHGLQRRMKKYYNWQLLIPGQSAGRKQIQSRVLPLQTPAVRISAASKGYKAREGQLFRPYEKVTYQLELPTVTKVKLRIDNQSAPFTFFPASKVNININDKLVTSKLLNHRQITDVELSLAQGQQVITLTITEGYAHQLFTVDLLMENKQGQWHSVSPLKRRNLYLSSQQTPLQYYLPKASLLRIDQYDAQEMVSSHLHYQPQAGFYTIPGAVQGQQNNYRVYQVKRSDRKFYPEFYKRPMDKVVAEQLSMLKASESTTLLNVQQQIIDVEDNTWGLFYNWRQRLDFDEGGNTALERFNEIGWQQRYYNALEQRFWRFDVLARSHQQGQTTLGMNNYIDWLIDGPEQLIYSQVSAFYQLSNGAQSDQWSGRVSLGWRYQQDWFENLQHRLNVSLFALKVADLKNDQQYWDNDVYSNYKQDHKNGLNVSNNLRYSPCHDLDFNALFSVRSNALAQDFSLESASIKLSSQLYVEGFNVNLSYQKRRFFADNDRLLNADRERYSLGLQYRIWQQQGQHWQLKMAVNYDKYQKETTASFGIYWNDTQGRGITDYRLSEIPFRDLYHLQAQNSMRQHEIIEADD